MSESDLELYGIVGKMLRDIRESKGYTLEVSAEHLGITPKSLQRYECGERKIKMGTLQSLCEFYGVEYDSFIRKAKEQFSGNEEDSDTSTPYYLNDETRQIAQKVFENPELRTLFHVARDISPERLKAHIDFMKSLKTQENGNDDEGC